MTSQYDLIFSELNQQEADFIGTYLHDKTFAKDEVILHQGSRGGDLYLIKTGSVAVNVALPGKPAKTVTTLRPGQVFGEIAFMTDALITSTIVCKEEVECAILESDIFHMIRIIQPETAFKIQHAVLMQTLHKILELIDHNVRKYPLTYQKKSGHAEGLLNPKAQSKSLKISDLDPDLLNYMEILNNLDQDEQRILFSYMSVARYEKGFHFDTRELDKRSINLIFSGAVMLFIKKNNELKKSLAVKGVGELFFRNFLSQKFYEVLTYVTCEDCVILELEYENYQRLKEQHPEIFYKLSQSIFSVFIKSLYIVNRQFVRINSELSY